MAINTAQKRVNPVDLAVGRQVRGARRTAGFALETSAALIGVPVHVYREQENGVRRIPAKQLFKLARLYRIEMATFFASRPAANA